MSYNVMKMISEQKLYLEGVNAIINTVWYVLSPDASYDVLTS